MPGRFCSLLQRLQCTCGSAKFTHGAFVAVLLALYAMPAHAGFVLSASAGYGHEVSPITAEQATNLMLTPGWSFFGDLLRPEVGVVTAYGAVRGGVRDDFQLELRPMLRAKIPLIPVYGRLVFAAIDLASKHPNIAYGGALGVGLSLFRVGIFGELGVLPRHVAREFHWILEGRLGVSFSF